MKLNEVRFPGNRKPKKIKRVGRGDSSGWGGTSSRGHKGQKARAGGLKKPGFEGGQMPLSRRLPKRGFKSINRRDFCVVNVGQIAKFPSGSNVDKDMMIEAGLIKKSTVRVKLLSKGDLPHPINIKVNAASGAAKSKIEAAGGKIEIVG